MAEGSKYGKKIHQTVKLLSRNTSDEGKSGRKALRPYGENYGCEMNMRLVKG